ncbi:CIC11C00000003380 [Sungouiella intermedia]|uniref:CIC11C00000003380 n=1 Tax=Sungouiella intermedia TaxID=45354 RepID=A0A1L0GQ67_9ASCO|nr:CIC11C00000003380 [[Candida] intermedia]
MLKFKNKFKFGSSEKDAATSSSPRNSSESRASLPNSTASPVPELAKLSLHDSSATLPATSSPAASKEAIDVASPAEPLLPTILAANPGVLIVKMYRSQNVTLPISINNDKQILQALALNTNDANVSTLLSKRLADLVQAELGASDRNSSDSSPDLLPGHVASTVIPSNIDIPNSNGERVIKPLLFMTVEFDNNMIMVESRKGTADLCQWDRVMTFDVTKMLAHSQTSSNFLNINMYLRLPNRLVPAAERQNNLNMFTMNNSNTFGDLQVGQIKLPLNLKCHSKPIQTVL